MIFLISIVLALLFILLCGKTIRKRPIPFYIVAMAIAAAIPIFTWMNPSMPVWISKWVWPVFSRGGLAGAFFIIVMITGAFPNGSAPIKRLMPVRGQISILASILTFGHNIAYGKTYFVALFTAPDRLPGYQCAAAVCSILMLLILIPLFVTSFSFVRKRMKAKSWKRLQRFAYLFYTLLCIHILLLTIPGAVIGRSGYRLSVFVYATIFSSYAVCRLLKKSAVKKRKNNTLARRQTAGIVFCMSIVFVFVLYLDTGNKENDIRSYAGSEPKTSQSGVFSGSGMGMNGEITVSVTVSDGKITDIVIDSQCEDEPYITDAAEVIQDILSQNSTDVDTISGATYSSGGIIDAVEDALKKVKK